MRGKSTAHGATIEAQFAGLAKRRGWQVHRSGWPDYLIVSNGKALFVEVKATNDRLRPSQVSMFTALELAGVSVVIWWESRPESLMPWRKFREAAVDVALAARRARRAVAASRNPSMCGRREMRQLERSIRRLGRDV